MHLSKKIVQKCLAGIYYLIIFFALMACALKLSTPLLAKYRLEIQQYLSKQFHNEVSIGSFNASWYGAEPVIKLNNVIISTLKSHKKVFYLNSISLGINLWQSLLTLSIQPGVLVLNGAELQVFKNKQNQLQVSGIDALKIDQSVDTELDGVIAQNLVSWFINQSELRVSNVLVRFKTKAGAIKTHFSSLKLVNEGSTHKFEGLIRVNNTKKTHLRIVGKWQGNQLGELSGKFYTSIQSLPLELANELLPSNEFIIKSGNGSVALWGEVQPNLVISAQAKLGVSNLGLENIKTGEISNVNFLKTSLAFNRDKKKSRLFFKNIELSPHTKFNKEHSLLWEVEGKRAILQASYLNLSAMKHWVNFVSPKYLDGFKMYHVHGIVTDAQLHIVNKKTVLFFGKFKKVGIHSENDNSFRNLTGEVYIEPKQGYLDLQSANTSVSFEKPYNKSLIFNELKGIYRWTKIADFWRVTSDHSYISMDNLTFSPQFLFDWKGKLSDSYLSLMLGVSGQRLEELKPYMPKKGMSQVLREWVNRSVKSIPHLTGHIKIKGRLGDLPFDKGEGTLQAKFNTENASVDYHPKWPLASGIDGQIFLDKRILFAKLNKLTMDGNTVSNLSIVAKPLASDKQSLYITLNDNNIDSQNVVNYMMKSPLKDKFDTLSSMAFDKKINLNLNFTIPLYDNASELDKPILGNIVFKDNSIKLFPDDTLKITSLTGALLFNEQGIIPSELSAKILSYPLSFVISNQLNVAKGVSIVAKGNMSVDKVKKQWPFLPIRSLEGIFDYQASLFFPSGKEQALLELNSDLLYVHNDMPKPFLKLKGKKQDLKIRADVNSKGFLLDLLLKDKLVSKFQFKKHNKAYQIQKGRISFKKTKTTLPNSKLLLLDGQVEEAASSKWCQWFSESNNENSLSSLLPLHMDVLFKKVDFYGQKYSNLNFKFFPFEQGSLMKIKSNKLKGKLYLPNAKANQAIDIDLDYLHHTSSRVNKEKGAFDVKKMPDANVKINNLTYEGHQLGKLSFNTKVKDNVLIFNNVSLLSKTYLLNLAGQWVFDGAKSNIEFEGFWQSRLLKKVLMQWGIDPVIESNKSLLTFKLKANKPLLDVKLNDLFGQLSLKLDKGRITHLSKEVESSLGLGKLISILSLQTLPRRLSLDFSDLSHNGFSFDILKGDFNLKNGYLATVNSYLDGPVSFVSMKGGLDVVKRKYNLTLKIVPHITASLPVVATIAAGPIAGIAAWVASKIINQGIRKVSSYTYKILGPWQEPVVHQVSIKKSKKIIK